MFKKIVVLGVMVVMVFSLFALTGCSKKGIFYSLQEAYDECLLTRDDIMHIAYFVSGEVLDENLMKIYFSPSIETPTLSSLDSNIVRGIKKSFYKKYRSDFKRNNANIDDITIYSFLGEYSGAFVMQVTATIFAYGTGSSIEQVSDIAWIQFGPPIIIFKIK